ncbi:MAG: protoporphyrinogen oxidase [Thermoanaerobaculia bacterium]
MSEAFGASEAAIEPGGELPAEVEVLVIGAGISGLALAWHLRRGGTRVAVLEREERVGGALLTLRRDGFLFELGPNTVVAGSGALERLLSGLGLEAEMVAAKPQAKKRYLWHQGRLQALPASPFALLASPLLSRRARLRLLREPWVGRASPGAEESVAAFLGRRLGPEAVVRLAAPFVAGVWAGDPARLSMPWAFPRLAALEREHGSLLRGLLASRRQGPSRGRLLAPKRGWGWLAERLAGEVGAVFPGTPAEAIARQGGRWQVATSKGTVQARKLVLAAGAEVAAQLLAPESQGESRAFAELPYAPMVVAAFGFRREQLSHGLDGFGFLAPRGTGLTLLGCLATSNLFAGRAPEGALALTAFAGGRGGEELLELPDEEIRRRLLGDLGRALGCRGEPLFEHLHRWRRAIPQYELGHGRFVELARQLEERLPGLYFGGNYLAGISLPDCLASAEQLAGRVLSEG